MNINFPKYNKSLLQKILDKIGGKDLVTSDQTIIGSINELANIIYSITGGSITQYTSLIQQILDLQSIIGNIHSWTTKSKYNDNIISAVDIIDSDITNIYNTKQDKIDYNIQGNNKDIVSVLNSIISKKIFVQDLDELYTMNLESGVYELIHNVNIPNTPITSYLLICQTTDDGSFTNYMIINSGCIGVSDNQKQSFSYINWGDVSIKQDVDTAINSILATIGSENLNIQQSIKAAINDIYNRITVSTNLVQGDTKYEYTALGSSNPFNGTVLVKNIGADTYKTYADISISKNASGTSIDPLGFCLVVFKGAGGAFLTYEDLLNNADDVLGVYSFGEDIETTEPATIVLYTVQKDYMQYVLANKSGYMEPQAALTIMTADNIWISNKKNLGDNFLATIDLNIIDIKNKIGYHDTLNTKAQTIIKAINELNQQVLDNGANINTNSTAVNNINQQIGSSNFGQYTSDKTITGAIAEMANVLGQTNWSFSDETVADKVEFFEQKIKDISAQIGNGNHYGSNYIDGSDIVKCLQELSSIIGDFTSLYANHNKYSNIIQAINDLDQRVYQLEQ